MEILNIGIPELLLILTLMLILLGPDGMVNTARTLAKTIRKFTHSPLWADMMKTQREIRDIPTRLVREAGYEDIRTEFDQVKKETRDAYRSAAVPVSAEEFSILPPKAGAENQPDPDQAANTPDEPEAKVDAEQPPKTHWSGLTGDHHQ